MQNGRDNTPPSPPASLIDRDYFTKEEEGDSNLGFMHNKRIPKLDLTHKPYIEWDNKRKNEYLEALASSMNLAADLMQQERDEVLSRVNILEQQIAGCTQNLETQKTIVMTTLTEGNAERENFIKRIQDLEVRIKAQDALIEKLNVNTGST